jgi:hypothetical protein
MRLLLLTLAALVTGCDEQPRANVAAQAEQMASINQRVAR